MRSLCWPDNTGRKPSKNMHSKLQNNRMKAHSSCGITWTWSIVDKLISNREDVSCLLSGSWPHTRIQNTGDSIRSRFELFLFSFGSLKPVWLLLPRIFSGLGSLTISLFGFLRSQHLGSQAVCSLFGWRGAYEQWTRTYFFSDELMSFIPSLLRAVSFTLEFIWRYKLNSIGIGMGDKIFWNWTDDVAEDYEFAWLNNNSYHVNTLGCSSYTSVM